MLTQETIIAEINQLDPTVFSEAGYMDPKGYLNRMYRFLNNMLPNKVYQVASLAKNHRLFVLVVQLYQCEVSNCTVSFLRNDYKEIRKNDSS